MRFKINFAPQDNLETLMGLQILYCPKINTNSS
jgi:hypothetical protein